MALHRSEKFLNAMKDVREGRMSTRKAVQKWELKKPTLHDRLNGSVNFDRRKGPSPVLTKAEENQIADWLIQLANRAFGLSKDGFLKAVKKCLDKDGRTTPFKDNKPGNKWFRSFIKRNPKVKLRKARPLEKKRASICKDAVDTWFTDFEAFLIEKGLANCPSQIWNCDETGFDLQGRAGTVIGPSTRKHAPYRVLSGSREHITMLPCFNACVQWMPPYFIFPGKRVPVTLNPLEGGVEGSIFPMTETEYMDTQTFYMWFANHFIPNLPPARPVVLLIDSHDSHLDPETFQLAQKNGICLHALLKNATHLVQPSDVGLFGPMKKSWYKSVREFSQRNPNSDTNKRNFCSVFKGTWEDVMGPSVLVSAFSKSGIYPLNRNQASGEVLVPFPKPSKEEDSPETGSTQTTATVQAFDALEAALSTPVRKKCRRRMEENYDLDGSPTFMAWKKLYTDSCSSSQQTKSTNSANEASEPDLRGPPKRKNLKRTLPKFVSGPEAMQLLLDEKLKKARQLAEKQKKMRDKEAKKEEKRKRIEEEKVRKQLEREEKKKKQKANKNASNERTRKTGKVTKRSQTPRAKGKQWRQQQCTESTSSAVTNEEDDICNICLQEYFLSDVENNPWVQCGSCKSWMHICCIPIGLDVGNKPFVCTSVHVIRRSVV
ncbi:uncharacterized protein [Montipora capricornis]|uniref:uncharacterized protein n=1 Tax=Montipora capricornis TaxID=246305 RepID=UPI0035F16C1D